jgi:hypothetical protein
MAASEIKTQFKVPEGRYVLHTAKNMGLVPFAMRRTTRLTIATLHGGGEEGMYMIYNVGDYLHVSPFDATEKVTQRTSANAACWMCYLSAVLLWHAPGTHTHQHTLLDAQLLLRKLCVHTTCTCTLLLPA